MSTIRNNRWIALTGIVAFMLTVLLSVDASAAPPPPYASYAVKFVCGPISNDNSTATYDAVKGLYRTAVNIHNPNAVDVTFYKKAVVALPERSTTRGQISQIVNEVLLPDQAMEVDCLDITKTLFAGVVLPAHIEGFVVIMVPPDAASGISRDLDVWGKYTARHRNSTIGMTDVTTDVESIDMEQVGPRQIK